MTLARTRQTLKVHGCLIRPFFFVFMRRVREGSPNVIRFRSTYCLMDQAVVSHLDFPIKCMVVMRVMIANDEGIKPSMCCVLQKLYFHL